MALFQYPRPFLNRGKLTYQYLNDMFNAIINYFNTTVATKDSSGKIVGDITGNAPTATSATTATKLQNARTIALTGSVSGKMSFDGMEDIKIETSPTISIMGMENYIVNGLEADEYNNRDLKLFISAGHANVLGKSLTLDSDTYFAFNPNKAAILYMDQNGALGKVDAIYPVANKYTVLRYVFNEDSGQVVDSSGNENHGTINGTVTRHVSGWADYALQSDGTGYIVSTSSKNFPIGDRGRTISILLTFADGNPSYEETLVSYGTAGNEFSITRDTSQNLVVYLQGKAHNTSYTLHSGETYIISYCYGWDTYYDEYNMCVFVNGVRIYEFFQEGEISTANTPLYILGNQNGQGKAKAIIHYLELGDRCSEGENELISNQLLLPCREYDTNEEERITFSRDVLPFDIDKYQALAIPLAFVRTDASKIFDVSTQHKYGIRRGIFTGARMQCLGWNWFNGSAILTWENPFVARAIRTVFIWISPDELFQSEVQHEFYNNGVGYGVALRPTKSDRIRCQTLPGGVCIYNGVWQTSGSIVCYAEVLE